MVVRGESLLLTRISATGYPAGWWALPGGGVDHGESPGDAMLRELYEETGLSALAWRLVDVHDVHTVSPGRGDRFEDYHGVHLLYAVSVDPAAEPRVVETGGTTDQVRWVPVDELTAGAPAVLPVVEFVVSRLDRFS